MFEPDFYHWARSDIRIKDNGKPTAFPEYLGIQYGFTQRPVTLSERFVFNVLRIWDAPFLTFLSILWWSVAWSGVARLFWRLKRRKRWFVPWDPGIVGLGFISVLFFGIMSSLAWFLNSFAPISADYFWSVFLLGLLLAIVLMRPRPVDSDI